MPRIIGKYVVIGFVVLLIAGGLVVGFLARGAWDARQAPAHAAMTDSEIDHSAMAHEHNHEPAAPVDTKRKVLYYWDPMLGPSSISRVPGKSSMGMEMVPVYADEAASGPNVVIDPAVVQNMGVQTALVAEGTLHQTVRAVGYLEVPEPGLHDITLKVGGYIEKLYADRTGMHVRRGDPLFDLYSPDLIVAVEELIAARKSAEILQAPGAAAADVRQQAEALEAGARRKLQFWDIPDSEIAALAKMDHAPRVLTIRSPAAGHVLDKMVVDGSAVTPGIKLMRIEDHRTLWLEAQVFEEQLPLVRLGETVDATLEAAPGKTFSGKIIFINPHLNHMTRATSVRVLLDNAQGLLKPGMYALAQIQTPAVEDTLLVPQTAIIDTGTRKLAFVEEEAGHFSRRELITGLTGDDDQVQVLSGLEPGELVVTSGQFLMDVESRTIEAAQKFLSSTSEGPTETPASMTAGEATSQASSSAAAAPSKSSGVSDQVVQAYLKVAAYLEQDHADKQPADGAALAKAAGDLVAHAAAADTRALAQTIQDAAAVLEGQSLEEQHQSFKRIGAAVIALIKHDPPSNHVATKLYILHCPMAHADWLQIDPAVKNPFLPSMRTCGSVTETFTLQPRQ